MRPDVLLSSWGMVYGSHPLTGHSSKSVGAEVGDRLGLVLGDFVGEFDGIFVGDPVGENVVGARVEYLTGS